MFRCIKNLLVIIGLLFATIIAFQELLIFPILWCKVFPRSIVSCCDHNGRVPPGLEEVLVTSNDGNATLDIFRGASNKPSGDIGLVFHGNGETIFPYHFIPFLTSVGITSYNVDYRGYGNSTGWPSEEGIYNDAESLWSYVKVREKIDPSRLIVLGNSIGSGPAAYLASKLHPKILVLVAPFEDITTVVQKSQFYKFFTPFLRYRFPVKEFISTLDKRTCVILAHGEADEVIPVGHTHNLTNALSPDVVRFALYSPDASHRDIYYKVEKQLIAAIRECETLSKNRSSNPR